MFATASAEFDACRETAWDWDQFTAALDRRHMVLAPWCAPSTQGCPKEAGWRESVVHVVYFQVCMPALAC
jgi:hypothetical protein